MTAGFITLSAALPDVRVAFELCAGGAGDPGADPLVAITGHTFAYPEVLARWPIDSGFGGVSLVSEVGFGIYDFVGSTDQARVNGCVYYRIQVSGAQTVRGFEFVVTPADPIITEAPFVLASYVDRLDGDTTGRLADLTGLVSIRFDGGAWSAVPVEQLVERGYNMYAVVLTAAQRLNTGRVFIRFAGIAGDVIKYDDDYPMAPGLAKLYAPGDGASSSPTVVAPARVQALPGTVDHVAAALGRLAQQFRGKPKIVALVTFRANRWQAIENVFWTLFSKRSIADRTGPLLDQVGAIVGQARAGLADANYRPYLYARIATDRSSGTVADLIKIARLILQSTAGKVIVQPQRIMTTVVQFFDMVITDPLANLLLDFLQAAAVAGERIIVQTSYVADARTFCCAIAAHPAASLTAGDTVINVPSTAKFPASGSLDIDLGLTVAETVTYTGVTATSFLGVSPLAHSHAALCAVQLHRTGRGLGRGSSASAITAGDTSIVVDNTRGFPTSGTLLVDGALFPYTAVPNATHFTLAAPAAASHPASVAYQYDLGGKLASARDRHYPVGS